MSHPRITSSRSAVEHTVDALIEQVEREWVAAEKTESTRVARMFTDPPHARRTRGRVGRTVLRRLPDLLRHDCPLCHREHEECA